jgi:uncharacterized delta-60 repeat protein
MKIELIARMTIILLAALHFTNAPAQTNAVRKSPDNATASAKPGGGCPIPSAPVGDTRWYVGAGGLDTTFATNGILQYTPAAGTITLFSFDALALQSDGKFVVAGQIRDTTRTTNTDIFVARFNTDSTLDTTFGNGFGYIIDSATSENVFDSPRAVLIQPDGKIVIGGGTNGGWVIFRYDSDGTRDSSFNDSGVIRPNVPVQGFVSELKLQPDGKLLAVGGNGFTAVRLKTDGTPDIGFGTNGVVSFNPSASNNGSGTSNSVAIQTIAGENRIVLAGDARDSKSGAYKFALMRLKPNGAIDTTFGSSGRVSTSLFGIAEGILSVAIDVNNKIVAGGQSNVSSCSDSMNGAVARYNENGTLDMTFGTGGKTTTDVYGFNDWIRKIVIQSDNKIVATGYSSRTPSSSSPSNVDFSVIRYNSNGVADAGFGPGTFGPGIATADINGNDYGLGIALAPDGGIFVAGISSGSSPNVGFISRYLP